MSDNTVEQFEATLVKALLPSSAISQYLSGDVSKSTLNPIVNRLKEISSGYVNNSALKHLNIEQAKAYALYYSPINFVKTLHLLDQVPQAKSNHSLQILDYGCGPGTSSFACMAKLNSTLDIVAYDKSKQMLDVGKLIWQHFSSPPNSNINFTSDEEAVCSQKFDIIIAANVLNEISEDSARWKLVVKLSQLLNQNGSLIILEPALQKCSHELVLLRDKIVEQLKEFAILFPCTHNNPCPMLQKEAVAWCHGTLSWKLPKLVHQLDQIAGFNKHRLKYSAIIMQRGGQTPSGYRVLTPSTKTKIGSEATLCGLDFYGLARLSKRDRNESNRSFEKLGSFERMVVEQIDTSGSLIGSLNRL